MINPAIQANIKLDDLDNIFDLILILTGFLWVKKLQYSCRVNCKSVVAESSHRMTFFIQRHRLLTYPGISGYVIR
jgi:hypothetical protein